jgi:hypothetical protein
METGGGGPGYFSCTQTRPACSPICRLAVLICCSCWLASSREVALSRRSRASSRSRSSPSSVCASDVDRSARLPPFSATSCSSPEYWAVKSGFRDSGPTNRPVDTRKRLPCL